MQRQLLTLALGLGCLAGVTGPADAAPKGYCSQALYESVRAFPGCVTAFAEELLRALYSGARPGEAAWAAVSDAATEKLGLACAKAPSA
jgi:hypothetical protein